MEHHQLIPGDMCAHPRPSEREIYRRDIPGGHMARPMAIKEREGE